MSVLQVGLGSRSYQIIIDKGCFAGLGRELTTRFPAGTYCLVTDDIVARLYGTKLREALEKEGVPTEMLVFAHGEASKNLGAIATLASSAARLGLDRTAIFIAVGGGVVGDICGFLAASYMRGVPYIQVPTSLLAQVDSSVGGKTGVDIPEGKNLVGAFYQPRGVYIDPDVLTSLPEDQYRNGLAEVIKYGVIRDPDFFVFLQINRRRIIERESEVVAQMIHTCCSIKANVVAEDEQEADIRRILNYGHTIGHAVEAASDFSILHGFAVAVGMAAAARIAVLQGVTTAERAHTIISLLRAYQLPTEIPMDLDPARIKAYLLTDKKRTGGKISYVLPDDKGTVTITDAVREDVIDRITSGEV